MKKILLLGLILSMGSVTYAKKDCTNEPKEKWMSVEDFKKKAEGEGYKISESQR